ncbi:MAG: helix-turn-helix transcriptional regulator [Actinomycetota bacterium]
MRALTVRALRRRRGWTQADLADRLGTDPVTVSRWERGVSRPRPSAQVRLQELATPLPADFSRLVWVVGEDLAERSLRRVVLLSSRPPVHRFAVDPTRRLREVDRALREQEELKSAVARLGR